MLPSHLWAEWVHSQTPVCTELLTPPRQHLQVDAHFIFGESSGDMSYLSYYQPANNVNNVDSD